MGATSPLGGSPSGRHFSGLADLPGSRGARRQRLDEGLQQQQEGGKVTMTE